MHMNLHQLLQYHEMGYCTLVFKNMHQPILLAVKFLMKDFPLEQDKLKSVSGVERSTAFLVKKQNVFN